MTPIQMPEEQWSEPEKWAWQEIRAGRTADFNARERRQKPRNPTTSRGWVEKRKLRSDFLKQILLRQPYSAEIPAEGVRIVGAWFAEAIELGHGRLARQLWLEYCRFEGPAELPGLQIDGWFSLEGSAFAKQGTGATLVDLNGARISGHVSLDRAKFQDVDLTGAEVGGQFSLDGATFDGKLNMNGLEVANLFMRAGAKFKDVELTCAKVGGQLSLNGATFDGKLNMNRLEVAQDLNMGAGAKFKDVELLGAKVGGQLNLGGATFDGKLNMNGLEVAQDLYMDAGAKFKDVELLGAKVGGQLNLGGATFDGKLNMSGLEVAKNLFTRADAKFQEVEVIGTKVGGYLSLDGATFNGKLNIEGLVVDGEAFVRGSTFNQRVILLFARFWRNLDFSNTELTELDLSGTRIEGELRLGSNRHPRTRWRKGAASELNLRNVHVGSLQDRRDRVAEHQANRPWWRQLFGKREQWENAWPAEIQLDGFTYNRLGGGFGGTTKRVEDLQHSCDVDMHARDVRWYIDWLARDHSYSPQPYEQLAGAFRAAGDPTKANRILYESRRRARKEAWRQREYFRWLGSAFLNWTIGYGLGRRYFRALGWVVAFMAVRTGVLYFSGQPCEGLSPGLPARFVYSLDQLLPIVEFEKYDKVALTGGVAFYFYVQKLVGWALGSFLVAGLAGLTQKQ